MVRGKSRDTVAYSVVTVVLTALLFVGGPDVDWPRSLQHAWDLGHVVLFWVAGLLALRSPLRRLPLACQMAALLLGAALLGGATEWLQSEANRSASWDDLQRDVVGAALAFAFASPEARKLVGWRRLAIRGAVLATLAWQVAPVVWTAVDEARARIEFPTLGDFENRFEEDRWAGESTFRITDELARSGVRSLRVDLDTTTYSGVALRHFPGDWTGYSTLVFSVFNPSTNSLDLVCKVNDRKHRRLGYEYRDRFNKVLAVLPGWNDYSISMEAIRTAPQTREMDLSEIATLQLFAVRLPTPRTIYLDRIALE